MVATYNELSVLEFLRMFYITTGFPFHGTFVGGDIINGKETKQSFKQPLWFGLPAFSEEDKPWGFKGYIPESKWMEIEINGNRPSFCQMIGFMAVVRFEFKLLVSQVTKTFVSEEKRTEAMKEDEKRLGTRIPGNEAYVKDYNTKIVYKVDDMALMTLSLILGYPIDFIHEIAQAIDPNAFIAEYKSHKPQDSCGSIFFPNIGPRMESVKLFVHDIDEF